MTEIEARTLFKGLADQMIGDKKCHLYGQITTEQSDQKTTYIFQKEGLRVIGELLGKFLATEYPLYTGNARCVPAPELIDRLRKFNRSRLETITLRRWCP